MNVLMKPTVVNEESETAISKTCTDGFGSGWRSFKITHLSTGDRTGVEMFEFQNHETASDFEFWKTGIFHPAIQDADIEALFKKIGTRGVEQRMPITEYYQALSCIGHFADESCSLRANRSGQAQSGARQGTYTAAIA